MSHGVLQGLVREVLFLILYLYVYYIILHNSYILPFVDSQLFSLHVFSLLFRCYSDMLSWPMVLDETWLEAILEACLRDAFS